MRLREVRETDMYGDALNLVGTRLRTNLPVIVGYRAKPTPELNQHLFKIHSTPESRGFRTVTHVPRMQFTRSFFVVPMPESLVAKVEFVLSALILMNNFGGVKFSVLAFKKRSSSAIQGSTRSSLDLS